MTVRIMIMAGGTGGHVFPALAVAEQLRAAGAEVLWMGTRRGLEARVASRAGYPFSAVTIGGLRGKGVLGWLLLPLRLAVAMLQCLVIILRFRPMAVLGMGGFVTGPGGLTTWMLHRPLLIHEQNAIAGLTNRWLARLASRRMVAFPHALPARLHPVLTGNPVRAEIAELPPVEQRFAERSGPLHLLVLGGSQGARALNDAVPGVAAGLPQACRPVIWHQSGQGHTEELRQRYADLALEARVDPFIEDMAEAYGWADLVVCRAGALTVAELAAAGVGAILVPYPHAVDDHQAYNAAALSEAGAGVMLRQDERFADRLKELLTDLAAPVPDRARLLAMAQAARALARPDAARQVSRLCLEAAYG